MKSNKYKLNYLTLYIISSNLLHYLLKHKNFIVPEFTTKYDNEILSKQGIDKLSNFEIDSMMKY